MIAKWLWNLLRETVVRWTRNDGNLLAASMAYYAAFSFFPLLLVLISTLGFVLKFSTDTAQNELLDFLAQSTTPELAGEVRNITSTILSGVKTSAAYGGVIGWGTLLVGAIGIFSQLETAFDRLWHNISPHDRGVWAAIHNALWNRLKAFLTLVGLGVVVMVAFIADLLMTGMEDWAEWLPVSPHMWQWVHLAFSVALNALVLCLVYRMIPRAPVRWRDAAWGGIAVALIWQVGSQIVSRFVVAGHYSAYGVVGSFIAIMLWVYCASILLFLGGQFVQVLGYPDDAPTVDRNGNSGD